MYEIEFYKGATEYEYAIDAFTGDILEFDAETDDWLNVNIKWG